MSNTVEVAPGASFEYDGDLSGVWQFRAAHLRGGYFEVERDDALTLTQSNQLAARALGASASDIAHLTGVSLATVSFQNKNAAANLGGGQVNRLISSQFSNGNYGVTKPASLKEYGLSKSEQAVLRSYSSGMTADEIAYERNRGVHTVRSQMKTALAKIGVRNFVSAGTLYHLSGDAFEEPLVRRTRNPIEHDVAYEYPAQSLMIDEDLETVIYFRGETIENSHFTEVYFNDGRIRLNDEPGASCEYTNVLLLAAAGVSVGKVARITGMLPSHVERCLKNLRQEAGVSTTAGAIHKAFGSGLLEVVLESDFDAQLSSAELDLLLALAEEHPGIATKPTEETLVTKNSLFNDKFFVSNPSAAVTTGHLLGIL